MRENRLHIKIQAILAVWVLEERIISHQILNKHNMAVWIEFNWLRMESFICHFWAWTRNLRLLVNTAKLLSLERSYNSQGG
jgi:hypothetical protein